MNGSEGGKWESRCKVGITAQSHPLIALRNGILTAQNDPRRTSIAERNCHGNLPTQTLSLGFICGVPGDVDIYLLLQSQGCN